MAPSSGFDPTHDFDCKMFDVANWVAQLNGEESPRGTPSHETLSVSPQGALEISLFFGHRPSLVRDHFSSPRVVTKSHKRYEGQTFSSTVSKYLQTPQTKKIYLEGCSLRASLYKVCGQTGIKGYT